MKKKADAGDDKRGRLTRAAAGLAYARGFGNVALADIAEAADVPLGAFIIISKLRSRSAKRLLRSVVTSFSNSARCGNKKGRQRSASRRSLNQPSTIVNR